MVLTLTANAAQLHTAAAAGPDLPHPSSKQGRSVAAVATLLDKLNIPLPHLPQLYNQCGTLAELADSLDKRERTTTDSGIRWSERLSPITSTGPPGAVLVNMANNHRRGDGQHRSHQARPLAGRADAPNRLHGADARAAAASQHVGLTDGQPSARCVLRLDFASPLVRHSVEHYLRHDARQPHAGSLAEAGQQQQRSTAGLLYIDHYRRRFILSTRVWLRGWPDRLRPGKRFTSLYEPHGNWQLLRGWLAAQAPHCAPADTALRFSSGVAAVDFVLEETYLYELYALNKAVAPDAGIAHPLNLTVSVRRQSPTSPARFVARHSTRPATARPSRQAKHRPCRACYKTGHTAEQCPDNSRPSARATCAR